VYASSTTRAQRRQRTGVGASRSVGSVHVRLIRHTARVSTNRASYRAVLRDRDFRALLLSDGLSTLGDQVARIAVALLVLERSGSALAASATYALSYLTWMIAGPLLSALPDRYPRRRVMVVCDLLRAALVAVLALPGLPLWTVFAVLTVTGLLAPPNDAARSALLADLLDGEQYVVANALNNIVGQAGQVLGFLLGGALVLALGVQRALLVDAGTFLVSALLLQLLVRERPFERLAASASAVGEALAGVRLVMGDPRLRNLLGWGLLTACSIIATEGLAVAAVEEQDGGPLLAGVLTGAPPVGFLVGSWLLLRVAPERREGLFPWLVAATCAPLLLSPLVDDLWLLAGLWAVAGLGNALQLIANSSFVQAVPRHLRGRAFGFAGSTLFATQGVVLLGAGGLAELTGPREAVSLLAAASLLVLPFLRRAPRQIQAQGSGAPGRSGQT
jgi:MFS family permease